MIRLKLTLYLAIAMLLSLAIKTDVFALSMPLVDDARKDPSLQRARAQLLIAIRRRDRKALLLWLDPDIHYAHGGGAGVRDFFDNWGIDSKGSDFWNQMEFALTHGGYLEKDANFIVIN